MVSVLNVKQKRKHMKLKAGDKVIPIQNRKLRSDIPMPVRLYTVFDIEKCPDKDKQCPKNCPGLISLDAKEFKCYAYESLEGGDENWQMILKKSNTTPVSIGE